MSGARIRSAAVPHNAPRGTVPRGGQAARSPDRFATPNADTSAPWHRVNWQWVYRAAHRCRRRTGGELADLVHAIALETVCALEEGRSLERAVNRAESLVEASYRPRGYRPQSEPRVFPGARLAPSDWRALYAWLRRVLPDEPPKRLTRTKRRHAQGKAATWLRRWRDRQRRAQLVPCLERLVLEGTLRGESLPRVAELLELTEKQAKRLRSLGLARCRRALVRLEALNRVAQ